MRIVVERSGGFTGMARRSEADTALLAPADARRIEALARAAEEERPSRGRAAADAFTYDVSIDGRHHRVRQPGGAWQALLAVLREMEPIDS